MTDRESVGNTMAAMTTDVRFEASLGEVRRALADLKTVPRDAAAQFRFCRAIREAKLCLYRVLRWYGSAYDVSVLQRAATQAARLFPKDEDSDVIRSVRRHCAEIRKRLDHTMPQGQPAARRRTRRKPDPLAIS